MSEPAYANLMFSSNCHQCLTTNIQNIIIPFSIRYCNNCKKAQCVESYLLGGRGGYDGGLTDDMFCTVPGERRRLLYHKPEVEGVWEKWLALPNDEAAREEFKEVQRERVHKIRQCSEQIAQYVAGRRASREAELKAVKDQKLDMVIERLIGLGWGPELDEMKQGNYWQLKQHASVRQLKRVSDKTWPEVENPLIELMKASRKTRLINVRKSQFKARLNHLISVLREHLSALRTTFSDYDPDFVDYAMMPKIRQLAEAPSSTDVTREDFAALKDQLDKITRDWKTNVVLRLSCIYTPDSFLTQNLSAFDAACFFDCSQCGQKAMQYPAVTAHECLRYRYYRGFDINDAAYLYLDTVFGMAGSRNWTCNNLVASPTCRIARDIIEICEENPDEIDETDMSDSPARVCCKTCSRDGVRIIMDWRGAIEHRRLLHSAIDQNEAQWEKVSDAQASKASELAEAVHADTALLSKLPWSCARCTIHRTATRASLSSVLEHVRLAHQIPAPSVDTGDAYLSGDARPLIAPPVVLVSHKMQRTELTCAEKKYCKDGGACRWDFDNDVCA
ncbi:hypothetical protein EUX98_g341 [Antrodiella citrinella]|uniref:Uncharacterized protein n=1 Tax=Antrodiella citrinella TaxID=2447956 RepID=A0A4S4N7C6_9APHY|nr:hypothetical protein EUX98_g341 [Antrodiella citrinella]